MALVLEHDAAPRRGGARRPPSSPRPYAPRSPVVTDTHVAAVFVVASLPVDRRHNSKIDRAAVADWAAGPRWPVGTDRAAAVKVLVTGATSLIGAHVVARLAAQRRCGHRATSAACTERSTGRRRRVVHGARRHRRPGRRRRGRRGSRRRRPPGRQGRRHADQRDEYVRANVDGTRVLLAAARAAGVRRFVHVSSPSVAHGGEALVGAAAEPADPTATRGHYATTKAEAELLALDAVGDGFAVVAIRPHLVWGPGDTQLVGRIVERARAGRLALVGSGSALIDTTYVDNAADALVAALDRAPSVTGEALVVSNGEPLTVREILERITAAAGVAPPRLAVPRRLAFAVGLVAERVWDRTGRLDDPPMTSFLAEQLSTAHWFDQRHTRDALGWAPAVSLDEGFAPSRSLVSLAGGSATDPPRCVAAGRRRRSARGIDARSSGFARHGRRLLSGTRRAGSTR